VSKTIPIALQTHKAKSATTLCGLLKIGPLPDGSYRGLTSLDVAVSYNDGTGSLSYVARTGMQSSAFIATADLGVDNAEAQSLPPIATFEIEGFTQAQIDSGALDRVPWVLYKVNYRDLTMGHEIVGSGTIGEMRSQFGQLTVVELRSLSQQLKQSVCELDSRTCRATFGSQPIGTGGGVVEERFPCGFDASTLWVSGTVSAQGSETDLIFSSDHISGASVASVTVTAGGSGYTSAPTVVFTGGGGTGAAATATITGDAVTSVTVTDGGYGYTSPPTVSFSGGGGTGAAADAVLGTPYAAGHFVPGVVEWLTGDNEGQKMEVEAFASGQVTLKFPTVNPILVGDTFRIRQDCNKRARDESKGCKFWFGAEWVNRFRGEPDIPTGDTAALNSPGAGTSGGSLGGTGEIAVA
jgi:hypothetical protein